MLSLLSAPLAQSCGSTGAGTLACACYMFPCADVSTLGTSVSATTTNGPITGVTSGGVNMFFGIPIAASTAGNNRFAPPQTVTPWTTPLATTKERPCPQWFYPVGGTEDCLTVDVLAASGVTGMATALWVHGGGFTGQNPYFAGLVAASNQPKYSYTGIANGGKTILMLVHYRLGALGWMSHPGFRFSTFPGFSGTNPGSGNWGMMDAINALKWAGANAANFGGDATKVNIHGESAGAAHVTALMASPLTQGLAQTFIAQSPFISYGAATYSMGAREEMDTLFTVRTGCSTTATVSSGSTAATEASCLRAAFIGLIIPDVGFGGSAGGGLPQSDTATQAFAAVYGASGATPDIFLYNSIHVWPVVDGFAMTKPPLESMASGNNAAASIVIGHNADEYGTFCYSPYFTTNFACSTAPDKYNEAWILGMYYLPITATWTEIGAAVNAAAGGTKYQQLQGGLYYSDFAEVDAVKPYMTVQMGTDAWFATGNMQMIEAALAAPGRVANTVYHYVFAHDSDPQYPWMGACHGCELTYVLGLYTVSTTYLSSQVPPSFNAAIVTMTAGNLAVGNAMNGYWASLFYNANPNAAGTGLPSWTAMAAHDKQTLVFSGDATLGAVMNPCARVASCRTENAKDWRMTKKLFWTSAPASVQDKFLPESVCTSAPSVFYSHSNPTAYGLNCSFLPCCKYTSGRRSLLFGMPSTGATACDPMC